MSEQKDPRPCERCGGTNDARVNVDGAWRHIRQSQCIDFLKDLIEVYKDESMRQAGERVSDILDEKSGYRHVVLELCVDEQGQCHGNVYCDEGVRVRVINRIDLESPIAQEFERRDILDRMPMQWREVYDGKVRKGFFARRRTLWSEFSKLADRDVLELLKCQNAITQSSALETTDECKAAGESTKTDKD